MRFQRWKRLGSLREMRRAMATDTERLRSELDTAMEALAATVTKGEARDALAKGRKIADRLCADPIEWLRSSRVKCTARVVSMDDFTYSWSATGLVVTASHDLVSGEIN